ncbi:pentapeptide MXKDX repeat protein [Methylobacterium durans]|uniref:pentapeptide MXKDX repeat protein n=1 Tax=Methylobacterium durans TaxID=2202825 RepID=UPI003C6DA0A4
MIDQRPDVEEAPRFPKERKERAGSWTLAVARYHAGPHNNPACNRRPCGAESLSVASPSGHARQRRDPMRTLIRTASALILSIAAAATPALAAEGGTKDSVKEPAARDSVAKDSMGKDGMHKGSMHKDQMHKGSMEKDGMAKDTMKK